MDGIADYGSSSDDDEGGAENTTVSSGGLFLGDYGGDSDSDSGPVVKRARVGAEGREKVDQNQKSEKRIEELPLLKAYEIPERVDAARGKFATDLDVRDPRYLIAVLDHYNLPPRQTNLNVPSPSVSVDGIEKIVAEMEDCVRRGGGQGSCP